MKNCALDYFIMPDTAESMVKTMNFIHENPKLMENKSFTENVGFIIFDCAFEPNPEAMIEMMKKLLNKPKLLENESFAKYIGELVYGSSANSQAIEMELIDFIDKNPKLLDIKPVSEHLGEIVYNTPHKEGNPKLDILKQILDNPSLIEDKKFGKHLLESITRYPDTEKFTPSMVDMINHIAKNPKLLESESIKDLMDNIIKKSKDENYAKAMMGAMDTLLDCPNLMKNESYVKELGWILDSMEEFENLEEGVSSITKLAKYVESKPEFLKHKDFQEDLVAILYNPSDTEEVDSKIKMMEYIHSNPQLLTIKNFEERLGKIVLGSLTEEYANNKIEILEYLKAHPQLLKNKSVAENLGKIIDCSGQNNRKKTKIKFMEHIINNPELLNDSKISDNIGQMIKAIGTGEDINNAKFLFKYPEILHKESAEYFLRSKPMLDDIAEGIKDIDDNIFYYMIADAVKDIQKSNLTDMEKIVKLSEQRRLVNAYHTMKGEYTTLNSEYTKEYLKFLSEGKGAPADRIVVDYMKDPLKDLDQIDNYIERYKVLNFLESQRVENFVDYCKYNKGNKTADYLYKEVYLKSGNLPRWAQERLDGISKKYGTKVFIHTNLSQEKTEEMISAIEKGLSHWDRISGSKAKMPSVLDCMKSKKDYIDNTSAYGKSASAGFCESSNSAAISIDGIDQDIKNFIQTLRHEMTHANDLKLLENFPDDFVVKNGDDIIAYQCKFYNDFLRIGIPNNRIDYAYNNPQEFIARAAEGDLSKATPEFKQQLIEFGMPEWMFNAA